MNLTMAISGKTSSAEPSDNPKASSGPLFKYKRRWKLKYKYELESNNNHKQPSAANHSLRTVVKKLSSLMMMRMTMTVMLMVMVMMMVMVAPPLLRRQRRDLSVGWSQPPAPRISGCTVYHFKNFYCSRLKNLYFPQKNIGFWDAATSQP